MARHAGLIASALLALAGHGLMLDWLARHLRSPAPLVAMVAPMYTRTLSPQPAAAAPAPSPPQRRAAPITDPLTGLLTATIAVPLTASPSTVLAPVNPSPPDTTSATGARFNDAPAAALDPSEPAMAAEAVAAPDAVGVAEAAAPAVTAAYSPAVTAADPRWPPATRLNYQLIGWFRGELLGEARVTWQQQDSQYEVRVDIDIGLLVSLTMTSQGRIAADGLQPQRFEETRRGRRRGVTLQPQQIVLDDGRTVPRPAGVQDTASQFVDLAWRFGQGGAPLAVGEPVRFWMARPGGVDLWTYDVVGLERLALPRLGEVEAFHLKPRPIAQPRGNVSAEMWFAPALQYLPVRIRIQQGPDIWLDLLVETIEQQ